MRPLACLLLSALVLAGCGGGHGDAFLSTYVNGDGRVVRNDQGGDTVSEGQAYAMLLTVAAGEPARFARVWTWTRTHLQRPDGLLAWRWAHGRVADAEPASDADLDAAWALMLAAKRFHDPGYARAGRALARAIGGRETAWVGGRTVLAAGPWATGRAIIDPSYFSPRAFAAIGRLDLAASAHRLVDRLTARGLPPDWAVVKPSGVAPTGPNAGGRPVYSYDAVRLPVWLAGSCDPGTRALAARLWPRLRDRPGAVPRALSGEPLGHGQGAVALAGAAAAAYAAGDRRAGGELLGRAARFDARHPSYYGSAWVALTRALLVDHALGACR
jgi:endoglucanase